MNSPHDESLNAFLYYSIFMFVNLIAYFGLVLDFTRSHSLISYVCNTVMFLNETWVCNYNT